MGKDQELLQVVKDQDIPALTKLLQKHGKSPKSKIIGNNKKFNINFQDADGDVPISEKVYKEFCDDVVQKRLIDNLEILRMKRLAEIFNDISKRNDGEDAVVMRMSALHQAALMGNMAVITMLLEHGAASDIRDNKGMIPLHYATWQGKIEPVNILIQKGSPVNEPALNLDTPIHLASQHGNFDVVNLLLLHQSDPTLLNRERKTSLDLAAEFGRMRVVELLLRSNLCEKIIMDTSNDMKDNSATTCLHLAARNGHVDIIRLLLQAGMDINRTTPKGTCLHEAALSGKIEVVKLLLDCGIDVNRPNSYDQTALDIVNKFTTHTGAKELKHILKEVSFAVQARAVKDNFSIYDPQSLQFKEGDIINVLEQRSDGIWKGYVVQEGRMAKTGYFPANHVVLVDSQTTKQSPQSKGIRTQVPDLLNRSMIFNNHDRRSYGSTGTDDSLPPPPSPSGYPPSPSRDVNYSSQSLTYSLQQQLIGGRVVGNHTTDHDWSNYNHMSAGGGDMRGSSPAKDSPVHSNRNSAASSDSGRGFSTGHLDNRIPNLVNVHVNNQHRLSGQSYESGVSSRQSYHSTSSSSLGSLDRLEESGSTSNINVAELFQAGVPDHEVLHAWLHDLRYEEYYSNFQTAGYDMPTISRMTPEDLTAIGITKPAHRKRLKAEIARLNIGDGIPDFKPNDLMEWLHLLGLGQYYDTLIRQEYEDIEYVTGITWEDLEEIGIKKLGHQKKIILAIERLKRISSGGKRLSSLDHRHGSVELLEPPPPLNATGRWSSELPVHHELFGAIPKKSSSGESISTIGSAGSGEMRLPPTKEIGEKGNNSNGYQPDVVAIQVKRNPSRSSTSNNSESVGEGIDMGGQPISYRSFQGTLNRKTSESSDVFVDPEPSRPTIAVAPVAPKVAVKPKPIAKIIAKTKRSSREDSPDFVELEKHESECNSDGKKIENQIPGTNSQYAGGTLKRTSKTQKEHIYDTPSVAPPKAPKPLVLPKSSTVVTQGPSSPLFVATNQEMTSQTPSPTGRTKKAPPPPPKRTNSIRDGPLSVNMENKTSPVHKKIDQSHQVIITPTPSPKPTPAQSTQQPRQLVVAPQQQTPEVQPQNFADCVKTLSERFGKKRDEEPAQDTLSSDGEEFPPPPPPIAMDIITPKIRNYGIPSRTDNPNPPEFVVQNKVKKDLSQSFNEKLNSERSFGGGQLRPHISPVRDLGKPQGRDKMSDVEFVKANYTEKRSDSTSSFDSTTSTSSGDSNTLPFANENVGTIKQRTITPMKPSIVTSLDGMDGERNLDLNSDMFDDNCTATFRPAVPFSKPINVMSRSAPVVPPKGIKKPPVPGNKPGLPSNNISPPTQQQQHELPPAPAPSSPKPSRPTETGNVLSDIDNMLQDLTEELDAMLVD